MQVGGLAATAGVEFHSTVAPKDVGWVEAASPAAAQLSPTAGCGPFASVLPMADGAPQNSSNTPARLVLCG
eukprot:COSAG01_NODE_25846_length_731_cov_1.457278_1_plen_70_part_01